MTFEIDSDLLNELQALLNKDQLLCINYIPTGAGGDPPKTWWAGYEESLGYCEMKLDGAHGETPNDAIEAAIRTIRPSLRGI